MRRIGFASVVAGRDAAPSAPYEQDLRAPRVSAFVAHDPAFTGAIMEEGLDRVGIPVLALGAGGKYPAMDPSPEARRLVSGVLAMTRYVDIADASHDSFLSEGKPEGYAILKAHRPGDEILCIDGDLGGSHNRGRDRASLHAEILGEIATSLVEAAILDVPCRSR